jgi:hypothetical protein
VSEHPDNVLDIDGLLLLPADAEISVLDDMLPAGLSVDGILAYLRAAPVVYSVPVHTKDRYSPQFPAVAAAWSTDGTWLWNGEVVAYVERHRLALPATFMRRVASHRTPPPVSDDTLLAAARAARRLQPPPPRDLLARHRADSLRAKLLTAVATSAPRTKPVFSTAWRDLQDDDAITGTLESMVRRLWRELRTSTAHSSTELLPLLQGTPGPVFTMGDEMVDEILRWTEGLPLEGHMDTGTRTFYAFVLAARLVDLLAAQSPLDLDLLLRDTIA